MKNLALAVVIAIALVGCSKEPSPQAGAAASAPINKPAPDFELENVAGGRLKAADLKGKVIVLDFWATWCEPCIAEIPKFNKMADEFKGKNVEVVGITVESPQKDIAPKVKETGMKYTVLVGNENVEEGFGGLIGFPTTFVLSQDWRIYKKYMGALPDKEQRIKNDVETLLTQDAANHAD